MKKMKSKRLVSIALSLLMIVSVIVPGTSLSAFAADDYFPAPTLTETPELLKEFATPDVTIPTADFSESYDPSFSGSVQDGAPVIATVTAQAGPNDSITLSGTSFTDATVYAYGLVDGEGKILELDETLNTADTINAIIDYTFDYSMYIVWVKSADGKMSAPVRVNAPELTWQSEASVSAGKDITLYGKFLTKENADEKAQSFVYVTDGTNSYKATVKVANPYKLTVTMPEGLADGDYKIWVHNGHGGAYGWSNSLDVAIEDGVENIWTGDTHTVAMDSTGKAEWTAIRDAILAASDYDTIYLPAGDYYMRKSNWYIEKKLRFIGETDSEGNPLARLIFVVTKDGGDDSISADATAIRVRNFPSEFRDLIFMDNIDSSVLADPTQFDIKYSYCCYIYATSEKTGVSHDNFRLEDCEFYTRRTAGGQETDTVTYADLETRYNYGEVGDVNASRYSQYAGISRPIWVNGISHAYINNNYVKAPLGIDTSNCSYAFVTNNTLEGVWIQRDVHQGGCLRDFSSSNLDISGNVVRGKDYYTDPDGELNTNDQTFGRGIVIQTPNRSDMNLYISENDLERVGQSNINAGELILFEDLSSLYKGGIAGISADTKTITLDTTVSAKWEEKWKYTNGAYRMYGYARYENTMKLLIQSHNPRKVVGQRVVIVNGTGVGQWRTITEATADSITVDRAWDVAPDSTSYIFIAPVCENVVMFKNRITGFKNASENYNSTVGIQAYETMLDTIADRNLFENVAEGVVISCHWDNRIYEGAYTRSDNTGAATPVDLIESNVQADYGVNVFSQFLNMNNTIRNARYGYSMPSITNVDGETASDDDFSNADADVRLQMGTVIRGNTLENICYGENIKQDSSGNYYNAFEKSSGIAFNIGKYLPDPDVSRLPITNEIYLSDIVIENNTTRAVDVQNVVLGYQQKNIVFRNNDFENLGRLSEYVTYPPKPSRNTEKYTINPPVYHSDYGTTASGMHISAHNVESTDSFVNGDFEQGLKYWADATAKGAASEVAAIVTDGTNEYLEITSKTGIESVGFAVKNAKSGEKYAFVYDQKGGNAKVTLSGRAIFKSSANSRELANGNAIDGFTKKITGYVTVSEVLDESIVDINCTVKGDGFTTSYIDNIELVRVYEDKGYFETLDGEKYYLADGQLFGGTTADGMLQNTEYVATEGMQNCDFSDGLKFWSSVDGTALASAQASVADGIVTLATGKGNGIMSAPFKVNAEKLSGNESENKAAFIIKYTGDTSLFKADLYVNGENVATSSTTGNNTLKHRILYFSSVTLNANDTYQVALYSNSSNKTVAFDYVNIARYNATTLFTDLVTGKPYDANGEITAPTSVDIATSTLYNGDFAENLNYWITSSGTATVADSVATLTSATLQSVYFDPQLEDGDSVAVLYKYKTADESTKITLSQKTVSGSSSSTANLFIQKLTASENSVLAVTSAGTYTKASGTHAYLSVIIEGTGEFDYISIVKVEEDKNLYTDIVTGEKYCFDLSVYGGTADSGIGAGISSSISHNKLWVTDLQDNLDFSNGFKYWESTASSKSLSDIVTIQDNGLVFNTANAVIHNGISTVAFKFPSHALGKKAVLLFDGRFKCSATNASGGTMSIARLSLENSNGAIVEDGVNLTMSWYQNTDNKWKSYASRAYTITDIDDTYLYTMVINDDYDLANCEMAIKNLRMAFVDGGGSGAYYNFDGSPISTVYGDANEDGLVNLVDYVRTARYLADSENVTIYKAAVNLDKDLDNAVSATDLTYLKEYLVSGIKNF